MQGPSPQGGTAKGTKSPPRTKSFGAVPIGGRSKWTGTGTWASRLAHPSCTIGADLGGTIRGRTAKKGKEATPRKNEEGTAQEKDARPLASTGQSGSHSAILAASHDPTAFGSSLPRSLELREQVPQRKPWEAWAGSPRAQSMCGLLVVSRGKDPKSSLSAPESFYCQLPVQTFPTRPIVFILLLSDPQMPQWESSVILRVKRRSSSRRSSPSKASASFSDSADRAARHYARHRARTCTRLNCPTRVRRPTEPGWGQSESLRRL